MADSAGEPDGMADTPARTLRIGETAAGGPPDHDVDLPVTLPLENVLRGRSFICGKSGSGKSNSASVVIEQILDAGRPLFVIDVEGEYYGLKESYELLHAGADEMCDIQVGPEHGERLAELSIVQGVPVILDLSGFLDESVADDLVGAVARALFATAKQEREPFPLFVEECHEFLPQRGSAGETGEAMVRISKRGRKHGLGLVGISQRPASVDKDFITQCNWLVWHRLTWDNDTTVVRNVLGKPYEVAVDDLADGEAFLVADPDVLTADTADLGDTLRVQFDRKRTYDAGAAPGLDDEQRPELRSVDEGFVEELQEISDRSRQRQDELERLRDRLADREAAIEELEDELEDAKDIRGIMDDMMGSLAGQASAGAAGGETAIGSDGDGDGDGGSLVRPAGDDVTIEVEGTQLEVPEVIRTEVMEIRDSKRDAEQRAERAEANRERHRRAAEQLGALVVDRPSAADVAAFQQFVAEFGELTDRHADVVAEYADVSAAESSDEQVDRLRERARAAERRVDDLERKQEASNSGGESAGSARSAAGDRAGGGEAAAGVGNTVELADADLTALLNHEAIQTAIDAAIESAAPAAHNYESVLAVLASIGEKQYRSAGEIATPLSVSSSTVRNVLKSLHTAGIVSREKAGRGHRYALDRSQLEKRIEIAHRQAAIGQSDDS